MLACFSNNHSQAIPIIFVTVDNFSSWFEKQDLVLKNWLNNTQFLPEPGTVRLVPGATGNIAYVICCVLDSKNFWPVGGLALTLPEGLYYFRPSTQFNFSFAVAWGLGAYQFLRYKKAIRVPAQLYIPESFINDVQNIVQAIYFVRDLINTPTEDLGPSQLAAVTEKIAEEHGAVFSELVGENLLTENFNSIYTVGRASDDAPRLLDLRWGRECNPKVTLVGKGVCFDSGGLNIKSAPQMALMKKDMAGGAHVLGLACMIMRAKLPVRLRVLIPAVENVVAGNAYRPGDIIKSRKGLTIEIGNTDAEGRVILADALFEATKEEPALLIDISTLTGAARVALGPDLPVVFSNHDDLIHEVIKVGEEELDPMWRLPLFSVYREYLNSCVADINNNSSEPYAGAITAALFLKEFVPDNIPWLHFDLMAWNLRARPGRPQGGEAMALRALFKYLQVRFGNAANSNPSSHGLSAP